MFSSNQKLVISGEMSQLKQAMEFAIKFAEVKEENLAFQITDDGKFCLGWFQNEYWKPFQFDYDATIVSKIIENFLKKQKHPESVYDYGDGCTAEGFLMKVIDSSFSEKHNGIKEPFYGIVSFEKYTNYYSK